MIWELPVVALRNIVLMPGMTMNVDVGRPKSKRAVDEAQAADRRVLMLTQREARTDDPTTAELYDTGVLGVIKQVVRMPDNTYQVLIEAQERARVLDEVPSSYMRVRAETFQASTPDAEEARVLDVLVSEIKSSFEEYQRQNKGLRLDNYQLENLKALSDAALLADTVTHHATWDVEDKQAVLAEADLRPRLEKVLGLLARDLERFNLDKKIAGRVKEQMDSNQREYYLREQMKAIGQELGGGEDGPAEAEALKERVEAAGMPASVKEKALKEIQRLERTPGGSPESTVVRNYVEWLLDLPWSSRDEEVLDIARTEDILNADHYALGDVKDRILEFLAVRQLTQVQQKEASSEEDTATEGGDSSETPERSAEERVDDAELRAPILCLVGPPGVGKTSLGKSIARSLNRKFVRMALGGMRDEAEVRGHRRTYIGSMPGRIIQGMKQAGVVNPIILLDEIDKMSSDWRGDPSSAMLEVLDPEQNHTFQDHYLEVPYDLSQVMFITTANSLQTIPRPLLDRMEVIQIPGYTQAEKVEIARRYRVPRQVRAHGLEGRLDITDAALNRVVEEYTAESGVRNLDRQISRLARKAARELLEQPWEGVRVIDAPQIPDYLGVPLHRPDRMEKEPQVGVAQGLAWTSVGGTMLLVEALATPGSGKINMTGSLGDVMKESVGAAIAYLRAHAAEYGADPDFHKNIDLHVHFPDGATPKDGPSAGITITTAVISAITGRPVRADVAMTGEISLRGRVLPIGGVKEKLLAAHQGGIREVIIPKDNEPHLQEVPESILSDLTVHAVERVSEVLDLLLLPGQEEPNLAADPVAAPKAERPQAGA
ncbi:anti-sigma H sporulation factor, LonB [Deinococcus proteolyticus MRP]|uniref:Lon protease n=1 Tax=Deinococcus proteolyticus (strain ATCC 35074 / DSM 20540 / JCM 6276 / NBRC 101906 / NCIMB 13154 / VKM Ac-1939 / CCM 2703 / MRP) TaxID=693977 RepID=F0RPB8_DEIPM|nr:MULTISPECIES: endopeptidase La [Deinococcus]ADY26461.1 anti-sigma H sporulation factor, LonB [Deinococcus proteolyticus MRP]MCY1702579.1 endopeptidase La [Deinococcus sp. SL84]